jgi:transposase
MGKSLSLDLRDRVSGFVDAGHSRRAAAAKFDVSASFAVKLLARRKKAGTLAPARQGRPAGLGKLGRYKSFLIGRVKDKPDITMPELALELEALHHIKAHPASLSRFLCKAGFSYKKNAAGTGTRTLGRQEKAAGVVSTVAPPAS